MLGAVKDAEMKGRVSALIKLGLSGRQTMWEMSVYNKGDGIFLKRGTTVQSRGWLSQVRKVLGVREVGLGAEMESQVGKTNGIACTEVQPRGTKVVGGVGDDASWRLWEVGERVGPGAQEEIMLEHICEEGKILFILVVSCHENKEIKWFGLISLCD